MIVASRMGLPLTNVSCSGATAGDLITEQSVSGPNIPAQLDSAFQNGTPALMTITAGANDVHWAEFIGGCFTTDCTGLAFRSAAEAYIATLRVKLHTALAQINTRSSGSPPPVIVTGYYQAISMACTGQQQNITSEEIAWLNSMTDSLNRTIQSVGANYSYVQFVPISFSGHDMCSADPWVQGTDSPAPFHPTARGQQIIAQSILAKANN